MANQILNRLKRLTEILNREAGSMEIMEAALARFREVLDVDRACLLYPCDPAAGVCRIRCEGDGPVFPPLPAGSDNVRVNRDLAGLMEEMLRSEAPVLRYDGAAWAEWSRQAGVPAVRSELAMALKMKNDRAWGLCLQRCSADRQWSREEMDLFQHAALRLRDACETANLLATVQKDIAKRQKVDADLARSEQRLRSLFQNSSSSLWLVDLSGLRPTIRTLRRQKALRADEYLRQHPDLLDQVLARIRMVDVNPATLKLFGTPDRQYLYDNLPRLLTPEAREAFVRLFQNLYTERHHFSLEFPFLTLKGRVISTILSIDVLPAPESHLVLATLTDITAQKEAEQRLLESRERYRLLLETANDAIFVADAKTGIILEANKRAADLIGRPVSEIVGMHQCELHPPEDRERYRRRFQDPEYRTSTEGLHDVFVQHSDGRRIPVEISASRTSIGGREVVQGIFHDISERFKTEERRRLLAAAVEQVAESVIITDLQGNIEYVNPAFEKITGYRYDEVIGRNPRFLNSGRLQKYHYQLLWQDISRGKVWRGTLINKKKDGTLFEEESTITPVRNNAGEIKHYVAVKRDITRQVLQERQIRQSQKMQAIGTLAGGVAHDFNNILTAILGFAELSLLRAANDPLLASNLQEIIRAADRAAKLIDQILTFSRQTEKHVASLQVSMIVKEVLKLLRASLPANIDLIADIETRAMVRADPTQIHQVIMNLCTNAYQALGNDTGWIRVSLDSVEVDARKGVELGNLSRGRYVRLRVEDNGRGIAPEYINRIFEPYFTTRKKDEGTGLGLSVVHGIVNDHGGAVTVESEPGRGSCFSVYLPEVDAAVAEQEVRETHIRRGEGRILVVDDEQQIVDYEVQVLEQAGYVTYGHTSSLQALEAFRELHASLDLVITDMAMPDMTGLQLYDRIKRIEPAMPVLLCTGYSEHVTAESSREMGINGYLAKPFTAEQLAHEVKRVLDEKRSRNEGG